MDGAMMRRLPIACLLACAGLAGLHAQNYSDRIAASTKKTDAVVAQGPFQADWTSLQKYQIPSWYADAKFGIFIHWGVYSVPGYGSEWYPREMYQQKSDIFKHHVATFGPQTQFGYKDFIPKFKAEKFDAAAWADLFKRSGAKYVVPVAEHHDGFPMYDCSYTDWSSVKMGPHRDIVSELEKAVRKQGLHFGVSSHRAEHWWFFDGGRQFPSDVQDPKYAGLYGPAHLRKAPGAKEDSQPDAAYLNDWLARTTELIDKYEPEVLWFDWWIEQPVFQPYLQRLTAYYYNRGAQWKKGVALNYKNKTFPEKAAVLDIERGKLNELRPLLWQTDTSVGLRSWGYIEGEKFRSADSLIDDLVDIVSKNGLLLLNIGPRPDGTIPQEAQDVLLGMGRWLSVNGEAIYGTRPWKVYGEGPTQVIAGGFTDAKQKAFTAQDVRFTTKAGALYAIALDWPQDGLTIHALGSGNTEVGGKIASVSLLGAKAKLQWKQAQDGLHITLPQQKTGDYAYAFKITLKK